MASGQDRVELDVKARQGETVVPGGTGGKVLEAQEHLAEGYIYIYMIFSIFFLNFHQNYFCDKIKNCLIKNRLNSMATILNLSLNRILGTILASLYLFQNNLKLTYYML